MSSTHYSQNSLKHQEMATMYAVWIFQQTPSNKSAAALQRKDTQNDTLYTTIIKIKTKRDKYS
jgi:hypothetical protein